MRSYNNEAPCLLILPEHHKYRGFPMGYQRPLLDDVPSIRIDSGPIATVILTQIALPLS